MTELRVTKVNILQVKDGLLFLLEEGYEKYRKKLSAAIPGVDTKKTLKATSTEVFQEART